ncbi:MAG: hypothetical protein NT169_29065 [Chloroflexi bacterium]|nr:hypothetical protein [Chloroflexota bacterium]
MTGNRSWIRFAAGMLILALLLAGVWVLARDRFAVEPEEGVAGLAAPSGVTRAEGPGSDAVVAELKGPIAIVTVMSEKNDVTPPLTEMKLLPPEPKVKGEEKEQRNPPLPLRGHVDEEDLVVQLAETGAAGVAPAIPAPSLTFEGISFNSSSCNCAPPDPNGDVGLTHYVQTVNVAFAIYNKAGTKLYGPAAIKTIWQGFGGACETRNDGDPILLYDSIADRWLISQFTAASPYYECVAISQTGDPTGAWYRYAFQLSTKDFPDYPKFGVWPDGYYMSVNWFVNASSYGGPRPYVFDRAKMLAGQPASFQTTSAALGSSVNPIMPSDIDGATLPPSGQPNVFLGFGSTLNLYKFAVNWTTPSSTTWTKSASVTSAGFTQLCGTTRNCIAQQGTSQKLDGIGDRLMNRLVYRNMGTYQSLLASFNVNAGTKAKARAGVRWLEIRNPAGTPTIYQQGTYAPSDTLNRWMGSIAMDKVGNIALGYSGSSSTAYPSIRYTARLATDPLGTMGQGEGVIYQGTGSQSGVNRWGDYSNLSVDPADNCTFWYTTEYNNSFNWYWGTKIGSFKLANCQ